MGGPVNLVHIRSDSPKLPPLDTSMSRRLWLPPRHVTPDRVLPAELRLPSCGPSTFFPVSG